MRRGALWSVAFLVVGLFVLVGGFLGRDGERTWALVSTIGLLGLVVLIALYLAINALQRLQDRARRVRHPFRRR